MASRRRRAAEPQHSYARAHSLSFDTVNRYCRWFGERNPLTLVATTNQAIVPRAMGERRTITPRWGIRLPGAVGGGWGRPSVHHGSGGRARQRPHRGPRRGGRCHPAAHPPRWGSLRSWERCATRPALTIARRTEPRANATRSVRPSRSRPSAAGKPWHWRPTASTRARSRSGSRYSASRSPYSPRRAPPRPCPRSRRQHHLHQACALWS